MGDSRGIEPMDFTGNLSENWKYWRQRFENYLVASEIGKKDEKVQVAQLIHYIGAEGIRIYNTFTLAEDDKNKLEKVLQCFESHFLPKKNLSYERFKFFTRKQGENEPMEHFITDLKNLALTCELQDLKDSLIKNLIICGLTNEDLRVKLLDEDDKLDLDSTIQTCIRFENTKKQSNVISKSTKMSTEMEIQAIHRQGQDGSKSRNWKQSTSTLTSSSVVAGPSRLQSHDKFQAQGGWSQPANLKSSQPTRPRGQRLKINSGVCYRCGRVHGKNQCPAYGKKCNMCGYLNHFSKFCQKNKIHAVNCENDDQCNDNNYVFIGSVEKPVCKSDNSWYISMRLNNKRSYQFKLDTGAMANIIPEKILKEINFDRKHLMKTGLKLKSYTNNNIPVIGTCYLNCQYKNIICTIEFFVVESNSLCILGLETCKNLNLIKRVDIVDNVGETQNYYETLVNKNLDLFTGIGCLKNKYHIELIENAKPVIHPPRKIPLPLLKQFRNTITELEKTGIIKKVDEPTDWVNSIVIVRKNNGSLRICLDPRDLNLAIKREHFQLPTIDQITSKLSGAKFFSKLDANSGFWQICLDEESSKLCTFATPYGRYCFLRLPYGIKSAPEVFHKRFREIFNLEGVELYIDDIIIWGRSQVEHDERLKEVFRVAKLNNITFNKEKCKFGMSEITFMGHKITKNGFFPDESKILAIKNMPTPKTKKEVQRFLGMITYVGRFIPNLSNLNSPLRELTKNDVIFEWTDRHMESFINLKNILTEKPVLQYYDIDKPVVISVDASKNGVGAVLLQNSLPCAYASRALTEVQQRYAQIEKELYAIVFGCEKFFEYVYGREFVVETDHKPLVSIFKKPLSSCPARLQRMLIQLQKYDFKVIYKPGKDLFIADALSRAFLTTQKTENNFATEYEICIIDMPYTMTDKKCNEIIKATSDDKNLQLLNKFIKQGWPKSINKVPVEIKCYFKFRHELVERNGLLFKGQQLIIPRNLRRDIINKIHYGHFGIVKCKNRAKESFYWPGMCKQIEDAILNCKTCLQYHVSQQKQCLIPHEIPTNPWYKIGCDILYLGNIMYLLVIDYYSKWVELILLGNNAHSDTVIKHLKSIFARFGIPAVLVSDGGPQFSSFNFDNFARDWGFSCIKSSPRYPQSNGMVERAKQTIKKMLRKAVEDNKDLDLVLLMYRNTPIENNTSPSQILMSRKLRDILPSVESALKPKLINYKEYNKNIQVKQQKQKTYYNKKCKKLKSLRNNQKVRFQNTLGSQWSFGKVVDRVRDRSYKIEKEDGSYVTRNRRFIEIVPNETDIYENNPIDLTKPDDVGMQNTEIDRDKSLSPEGDNIYNIPECTSSGRVVKRVQRLEYS